MAVDKAPPDAAISAMPGVSCRQEGGFGLAPPAGSAGRLVVLGQQLLSGPLARLGAARNFVCTLRFQSETVHATAAEFEAISVACLLHGDQNKHELTFAILRWGRCGTAAAVPLYRWWMPLLKRTASPIV